MADFRQYKLTFQVFEPKYRKLEPPEIYSMSMVADYVNHMTDVIDTIYEEPVPRVWVFRENGHQVLWLHPDDLHIVAQLDAVDVL